MRPRRFRVIGDTDKGMSKEDLMYAAEIAFGGGLFETMPLSADEALDAFEQAGIDLEEVLL